MKDTNKEMENEFIEKMNEAVKLHKQAAAGDKEAVGMAYKIFAELYAKYPQNRTVQAYMGSITSLKGRDTFDMIERSKYASKGVKLLNQAVLGEKENIEIRLLRANVCLRLPEIYFHKTATAIEDLNYIIERYDEDNDILPVGLYLKTLYDLGCAYTNLELARQANKVWERLLKSEGGEAYKDLIIEKKEGTTASTSTQASTQTSSSASNATPVKTKGTDGGQNTDKPKPKKKVWTTL